MILEPEIKISQRSECTVKREIEKVDIKDRKIGLNDSKKERITIKGNLKNNSRTDISFKWYFVISMFFLSGILFGCIYFRLSINNTEDKKEIIEQISMIENSQDINIKEKIGEITEKNIWLLLFASIIGASAIGSPFLILMCAYKGFTLAFTISAIILKYGFWKGNLIALKRLYPSNLFYIFALFIFTISSLKVSINILKNKKDIRLEILRHLIITLFGIIFLIMSAVLEILLN